MASWPSAPTAPPCLRRLAACAAPRTASSSGPPEGRYPAREGELGALTAALPHLRDGIGRRLAEYGEGRFAVKVVTRRGTERIARFACELARRRRARGHPGQITCVTKSNVLRRSDGLFREVVESVVRQQPDLAYEHFHVDDAAR